MLWSALSFVSKGYAQSNFEKEPEPMVNATPSTIESSKPPYKNQKPLEERRSFEQRMIRTNILISEELDKTAGMIDHFLADGKQTSEKNATTLTLENRIDWIDGEDISYKPHVDIDLHLPNLEEKWKLRFTSYDEDSQERGINRNRLKTQAPRENYGASLSIFEKFGRVETTFRPRLEFKDTIQTSFILRLESPFEHTDVVIRPKVEFFGRSDTGTGQFAALNFDFPLSEIFLISLINEQQYTNTEHYLDVTHGIGFTHFYNDSMHQNYRFNLEYNNKPAYHLSRYTFSSSFNHELYRNIFHYSVIPYVAWSEKKDFSGKFGLELLFEFIF